MTIAEVSKKFELTIDTLRYYERIELIPSVPRTKGGIRDYGENECNWIEFIKCMRAAGLPVEALIEYVGLFQAGEQTVEARKEILTEQRKLLAARIDEMKQTLNRLDYKIEVYEKCVVKNEKTLRQKEQ